MFANSSLVSTSVSDDVGSSSMSTLGSIDIALSISTTCRLAIESSPTGTLGSMLSEPKRARSSELRRYRASQSIRPRRRIGCRWANMFSATLRLGTRLRSWCTTLMPAELASCGEAKRTGLPASSMSPSSGECTPPRTSMSVLLPAPFSPTKACTEPFSSWKSTPSRAFTPGKLLLMPRASRMAFSTFVVLVRKRSDARRLADVVHSEGRPPRTGPLGGRTRRPEWRWIPVTSS